MSIHERRDHESPVKMKNNFRKPKRPAEAKTSRTAKRKGDSRAAACSAHVDRLYKAVQNYVEKGGGKLTVIGGIAIQEWPTDNAHVFHVAVKCLGRKPSFVGLTGSPLRCQHWNPESHHDHFQCGVPATHSVARINTPLQWVMCEKHATMRATKLYNVTRMEHCMACCRSV